MVAVAPVWMPYARDTGLAAPLLERPASPLVAAALAPAAALATVTVGWVGGAAVGAAVLGAVLVLGLAWRRVGGFTGDVLGAAIVVGETVGLVVAAARW